MAEKTLLSDKFRSAIEDSDFVDDTLAGLYDAVEGMSDEDFREYMYSNRVYFNQNMPMAVDEIPGFRELVSKEPDFGVRKSIDYEKVTGSPDALDRFYDYTMKDMDYFGSQVGMTGKEFMKRMAEDKTKLDRQRIAHGEDEGGWTASPKAFAKNLGGATLNLLSPRVQEAIARGEDPTYVDVTQDAIQNMAYSMPWGKFIPAEAKFAAYLTKIAQNPSSKRGGRALSSALLKAANVDKAIETNIPNALTPALVELSDWAAYKDTDNPRGEFSVADIVTGVATNRMAGKRIEPFVMSKLGAGDKAAMITPYITNQLGDRIYNNQAIGTVPRLAPPIAKAQKYLETLNESEKRQEKRTKAEPKWQAEWRKILEKIEKEKDKD